MNSRFYQFFALVLLNFGHNNGQIDGFLPTGYEEVTKSSTGGFGAIDKCGEGATARTHICVPYYMCDGKTKTVIQNGKTDGFGIIDIRFGENSCPHPLDVCCKLPPGDSTTPPTRITVPTMKPPPSQNICGIRNNNGVDFKITGNTQNEAEYGEFPWMVAVLKKNYTPSVDPILAICGGSLIAPNVVLTAAHCVYKYKSDDLKIRAGEWDTQTDKERLPYQERELARIIIHPDYQSGPLYNDAALLILTNPVNLAEHIATICLPEPNVAIQSRECYATGWGKNVFGREGQFQVILKKIQLPTVEHGRCEEALRQTRLGKFFKLDASFTCAGGEMGRDTCTGDGGSPLVCPDPSHPARYVQAGIVAWGIGCGEDGIPGVYGDVTKFRQWIDEEFKRLNIDTAPYLV